MKQKGFTIIEALVVIAVISSIILISVTNFTKAQKQLALSRVAVKFSQDVRKAQQLSFAESRYFDSQGVEHDIAGKGIYLDLSSLGNTKYIIYADDAPGNNAYDSNDYILETVDFSIDEPGIIIKNFNNITGQSASIDVKSSNNTTYITPLTGGQIAAEFVFAVASDPATTKTVSVNTSGLIEVK